MTTQVELTDKYWDCECEQDFIHSKNCDMCIYCGALKDEQPDSRVNEVKAAGHPQ